MRCRSECRRRGVFWIAPSSTCGCTARTSRFSASPRSFSRAIGCSACFARSSTHSKSARPALASRPSRAADRRLSMIPVLLATFAVLDGAFAGFRAAAGCNGRIDKRSHYFRAMVTGAATSVIAVCLLGVLTALVMGVAPDSERLWADLLGMGVRLVAAIGVFTAVVVAALTLYALSTHELRRSQRSPSSARSRSSALGSSSAPPPGQRRSRPAGTPSCSRGCRAPPFWASAFCCTTSCTGPEGRQLDHPGFILTPLSSFSESTLTASSTDPSASPPARVRSRAIELAEEPVRSS